MVGADSQLSRPDLVTSRARYRPTAKRVRSKSDCDGGNYLKWTSDIKGLQGGFSMSESGGTTVVDPPPSTSPSRFGARPPDRGAGTSQVFRASTFAPRRTFAVTSLPGTISLLVGRQIMLVITTGGALIALVVGDGMKRIPVIASTTTVLLGGLRCNIRHLPAGSERSLPCSRPNLWFIVARDILAENYLENPLLFAGATLVVLPLVPNCPWAPTLRSILMRLGCRHTNHSCQRAGLDFLSRHWFQASFRVQRYPASGFTSFC